jgi:capsular exopolysaccharide synthesis family protein
MAQPEHDGLVLTTETLNSHFAEAYRVLRANISFSSIDQPVKTILVTSAAPREGKSTTVINLGIIMAQSGSRVLVVDADFRRPSLHHLLADSLLHRRQFWSEEQLSLPGLSNMIVGNAEFSDVVLPTPFKQLALLPAGKTPPNPSELLGSARMRYVVKELTEQADYVLIDTPPCLLYADAIVLSRLTDGILYVLRSGSQDKTAQRRIQKQLQQAKSRLLGVVFNSAEVEESANSYTYYYADGRNKHRK